MKPSIPSGTRDFGPREMRRREHILRIIRHNLRLFGFEAIETPAMENIETLTGKYGEEGDQLIFKILNSRLHDQRDQEALKKEFGLSLQSARNSRMLTEKALRYDLTVPFARFVAMNRGNLVFPFRRSQVQPVWRADRPQKGRYREFYQCDADIIGSVSLTNELELIALIDKCFSELKVPAVLKFNNRKLLAALAVSIGEEERLHHITMAIDKLDKVGRDGVVKELAARGISQDAIDKLSPLIDFKGSNAEKTVELQRLVGDSELGRKGLEEAKTILDGCAQMTLHIELELDITLARGLDYYTGTIYEAKAVNGPATSLLGGGRYDDLTGIFGVEGLSGVGISFGIDRIYDLLEDRQLFPAEIDAISQTTVLFTHFDEASRSHCLVLAAELRRSDIACEVYPDVTRKIGRQIEYAHRRGIPYVCTVGSNEMQSGAYTLKHMSTGVTQQLGPADIIHYVKSNP